MHSHSDTEKRDSNTSGTLKRSYWRTMGVLGLFGLAAGLLDNPPYRKPNGIDPAAQRNSTQAIGPSATKPDRPPAQPVRTGPSTVLPEARR